MKRDYQLEYAEDNPLMYDARSRRVRAKRLVKTLEYHLGKGNLKKLDLLDVGSSSGIVDDYLARHFRKVVGIDVDRGAVNHAKKRFKRKNLTYKHGDAMNLEFKDESFDVVICLHVYEHVPNDEKLMKEIYRVLKKDGVCYMALANRLWPIEFHYKLPFLSWLPRTWADYYLRAFGMSDHYYEKMRTYWGLLDLTKKFRRADYTPEILRDPKTFGYDDILEPGTVGARLAIIFAPLSSYFAPTFFWILSKE